MRGITDVWSISATRRGAASPAREIVGIVADIKDGPPGTSAHPSAYVPFDETEFALVICTRLDKVSARLVARGGRS